MKLLEARSQGGAGIVKFTWQMDEWGSIVSHRIIAETDGSIDEFDLGACAAFGFRRVCAFFAHATIKECSLGFRNPHIIIYGLKRDESSCISLTVEDASRGEPFVIVLGEFPEIRESQEEI